MEFVFAILLLSPFACRSAHVDPLTGADLLWMIVPFVAFTLLTASNGTNALYYSVLLSPGIFLALGLLSRALSVHWDFFFSQGDPFDGNYFRRAFSFAGRSFSRLPAGNSFGRAS